MAHEKELSLSKYFANDPPSFFDHLANKEGKASTDIPDTYVSYDYLQNPSFDTKCNVPDSIRDLWDLPTISTATPIALTMPGISVATDLNDPVQEAVGFLIDPIEGQHRKILSPDDVTQDERGLRELIEHECFRSAVNLTARLLTIKQQGFGRAGFSVKHSPNSLQLWFTRLALLVKLGQYDIARVEAEPFESLNKPDMFYEFYHPDMHADRKGSMAPFSFRLLLAELPIYLGAPKNALDKLMEVLAVTSQIRNYFERFPVNPAKSNAEKFWHLRETRILHSIVNCSLLLKDFSLVDQLIRRLVDDPVASADEKCLLLSSWGRIRLQCGDIYGAEKKFSEAKRFKEGSTSPDFRELIDRGLLAVAQNDFQSAYGVFQKATTLDNSNTMVYNNMGVCLLYSGKLKEAIKLFEGAVHRNPRSALNESLMVNLATLYELESNNSKEKKVALLKLVNKHRADLSVGLDVCLKLQTVV
ncbi:trafficking protein particle complex subunit 12 [Malaya genurostris]|uniref:trafficking protein particle complex subunit 12 n=1 Tax=Malaya genurostris TaxID=325434 RepID=UPI0026F3FBB0|nr:trafficking protein particle complex subunit 12 [Malaya genurostris]XP_058466497.1 trafficking protein particle complex subunit 12 [Malaya genurostris]XP_058466498.1 trafficking protein particle complex subunit 12 [Malaya genurostris]